MATTKPTTETTETAPTAPTVPEPTVKKPTKEELEAKAAELEYYRKNGVPYCERCELRIQTSAPGVVVCVAESDTCPHKAA